MNHGSASVPGAFRPEGKAMERYHNRDGGSKIAACEIGSDFIRVRFTDRTQYLYTNTNAGPVNVELMKQLAIRGEGLHDFNRSVIR